jgi:AMMECR1 domain-containing protein
LRNAVSSCSQDPRFNPVRPEELEELEYSVDVLMPSEKIQSKEQLDVKKYGVIVTSGFKRGLLLPNLEGVDTVDEQIDIALQKAGIERNEKYNMERFEVVRHK